jgi:tetratricopeptide (TPR) repeat protein
MESIDTLWNRAVACHRAGSAEEAGTLCRQLLAAQPDHGTALLLFASILLESGDAAAAREQAQRAAQLYPGSAEAHLALGTAHFTLGDDEHAMEAFRMALRCRPTMAEAHHHLAVTLHRLGRLEEAIAGYRTAIALRPGSPDVHNQLGTALEALGRTEPAVASFRKAVQLRLDHPEALTNLTRALVRLGRSGEAEKACRLAIEHCPESSAGYQMLGVLLAPDDEAESLSLLQRAFQLDPNERTRHDLSVQYTNIGRSQLELDRLRSAMQSFDRAIEIDPSNTEARFQIWNRVLSDGDYTRGFQTYDDWMEVCRKETRSSRPRWRGEPMPGGTLLVYSHHGIGHALLALRYLPIVAERSGAVIVFEGPRELLPLVANLECVHFVVEQRPDLGPPEVEYDADIDVGSLLALCYPKHSALPPYVTPGEERLAGWREWLSSYDGFRVGICWTGDPANAWNDLRSCPLRDLVGALRPSRAKLFSLQVGPLANELGALPSERPVVNLGTRFRDFEDTAAMIANMDLVVSVETATAHLAGALGRPCWTLLAHRPGWMWRGTREQTQWYPSMRLFRQPESGDWNSVLGKIASELAALVEAGRSTPVPG